ncbi:MAG: GNAT family N-acetyltransferase [Gemmataceae bacterium]|nr:GNAT family N-acetyltransferase [Gemmata sp.]MDW8198679.1 GNAT family N-acetyltransferase [Gemmataceae bacterium]
MLAPITIRYRFAPQRRSWATVAVADQFGLSEDEPEYTICENLQLDIRPADVVLFVGPSGSGKSSLLRAVAEQLHALDIASEPLPEVPLIDALPGALDERLALLAACGLSEARLFLRTPQELSEGQRYRFRLGWGAATLRTAAESDRPPFLVADEFTATLDRTLAKCVAFNMRKWLARLGVGLLAATTHDDILDDLNPDVVIRCRGEGNVSVERRRWERRSISFASELWLSDGSARDWPYFARWHYRGQRLAFVKRVFVLWHRQEPVGICVFATPAASLSLRSWFFGLQSPRSPLALAALNEQLWLLQRVVLHPTYRGVGIAAALVRRACQLCPVDWIETLSAMGQSNPVFERAGFRRIGVIPRCGRSGQFGPRGKIARATAVKSDFSNPVYYLFDNRQKADTPP